MINARTWQRVLLGGVALGASVVLGCGDGDRRLAPIRLESMLTVGVAEGDGVMMSWPRVSPRFASGIRILVPQPGGVNALPAVFGDDGRFLGTLGAEGDAPGEFQGAIFARVGPGDSIYLFAENQRAVVFGDDRTYGRK